MIHTALMAFGVVVSILVTQCDIGAVNIGDFIRTYTVTVTNAGDENAFVTIAMPDSKATVLARPGDAVELTGFQAGSVGIFVTAYDLAKEVALYKLKAALVEMAHSPKLSPDDVKTIWAEIYGIENRIAHHTGETGAAKCTVTLSAKKPVAVVAALQATSWTLDC